MSKLWKLCSIGKSFLQLRNYNYIRNCASNVGITKSRKFSVHLDREANECKVTRHA